MVRPAFTALVLGLALSCALTLEPAFAQNSAEAESWEVAGTLHFSGQGELYVCLADKRAFAQRQACVRRAVINPGPAQRESGTAAFTFTNVPAGDYAVRSFQDRNGNGELDRGLFGPSEPWGMSFRDKRPSRAPRWEEVNFPVRGDVLDVRIELK